MNRTDTQEAIMDRNMRYIETLIEEKDIDTRMIFEVAGPDGTVNLMSYENIMVALRITTPREREAVANMLRRIDFANGDITDYLRHLAQALAL